MSTFDEDENSVAHSRPTEYLDIAISTGITYRIACGPRDLPIGSLLYTATPAARSDIEVPAVDQNGDKTVTVTLPVTHELVKRWFVLGVPPRDTLVTIWRKQERSGVSEKQFVGVGTGMKTEGNLAKLQVSSVAVLAMQRYLPTISASTSCQHTLYDSMCKVARASFLVTTTAMYVDGTTVRVDMGDSGRLSDWAEGGELIHVPTGQKMTIAKQSNLDPASSTVADLTIQLPIYELKINDAIQVYAGCKKGISICNLKFNNKDRYGGYPDMPSRNPIIPTTLGVGAQ